MKLNQIHIQEGPMVKILELFPDVDDFLLYDSFQVAMESKFKKVNLDFQGPGNNHSPSRSGKGRVSRQFHVTISLDWL